MCYSSTAISGSIPVGRSAFGSPPDRSIYLDNVVCVGTEDHLLQCDSNPVGTNNCDRSEEAGVRCEGKARLVVPCALLRLGVL